MFLGSYSFEGDPTELVAAYERLMAQFPPESTDLHVCVVHDDGILVLDACPSRAVFEQFSQSPQFRDAVATAGLPSPRVDLVGEVHAARGRGIGR